MEDPVAPKKESCLWGNLGSGLGDSLASEPVSTRWPFFRCRGPRPRAGERPDAALLTSLLTQCRSRRPGD